MTIRDVRAGTASRAAVRYYSMGDVSGYSVAAVGYVVLSFGLCLLAAASAYMTMAGALR